VGELAAAQNSPLSLNAVISEVRAHVSRLRMTDGTISSVIMLLSLTTLSQLLRLHSFEWEDDREL